MHVADFESRALAGQASGSERREPPLMRDLRQRIGLIHELRELRGAEELLDHRRGRLVVHQLLRHQGFDVLQAHPLFDRALHPHQSDAELVLDQLADRAHAAVTEMVDIVDLAVAALEVDQVAHHFEDVLAAQRALLQRHVDLELMIQLQAPDLGEVIALGIEEQVVEEGGRGLRRRRIAGAQPPINLDDRVFGRVELVRRKRHPERSATGLIFGEEHFDLLDPVLLELLDRLFGQLLVGLQQDFAGVGIDHIMGGNPADDLFERDRNLVDLGGLELAHDRLVELAPFARDNFT